MADDDAGHSPAGASGGGIESFDPSDHQHYPSSTFGDHIPGIATGRDVEWEPLVDYRRNGVSETTIHGAIAWAHGSKVFHSFGGNVLCYGRSMMKPLLMKVFVDELAGCSWKQKAISVASHNTEPCKAPSNPAALPKKSANPGAF